MKKVKKPYFKNMKKLGFTDFEKKLVLNKLFRNKIFDQPVNIDGQSVYDTNGNLIYYEDRRGYWRTNIYDTNSNLIYYEDGE